MWLVKGLYFLVPVISSILVQALQQIHSRHLVKTFRQLADCVVNLLSDAAIG